LHGQSLHGLLAAPERPPHNPAGARAAAAAVPEVFGSGRRLIGVVGASADKDVRGLLEAFEPVFAEIVITRNSSARPMNTGELAAVAIDVFGKNRVRVVPALAGALGTAVARAGEESGPTGGGVLVTGSVITVGGARLLLGEG
jgi:dihydrofolate synthase/folylpolyglutamate synthase